MLKQKILFFFKKKTNAKLLDINEFIVATISNMTTASSNLDIS